MNTFDRAVDFILRFEGEHSDDPHDSGGDTWYGLSRRAHPTLEPWPPTRSQAVELYRELYWNRSKCNELPTALAMIVFDSAVNQGATAAARLLQKSLGVRPDGVIGPETIAVAHRASLHSVVAEFIAQRAYQYSLHPEAERYGLGWFRRLSACHQISLEPL